MEAVNLYKTNKASPQIQDVTLASQDGNWTRLCEEGSGATSPDALTP